ncbi:hypothetical protein HII31_12005 [Pseudocercospora fuligena]|uniref:Uncharacterized protein n=1 Tax=Pseudocercospora fuligena TaxID=685502 RepID=A0A8H6R8M3_9PEZI|nr:hypothetical protein HII31_12005 [Pseudocercospora fuligena]
MPSTQSPFDDPPPYTPASSWASESDRWEEDSDVNLPVASALQPARATPSMTDLGHGPQTEKMKDFLTFVMFRDYVGLCSSWGCHSLRASTRDYFLRIVKRIERANPSIGLMGHPNRSERGAKEHSTINQNDYLWRNVYEPCRILRLPQDAIVATIMRFYRYRRSFWPKYYGCISHVVKEEGMQSLARKIAVDREVIIPYLDRDGFTMRKHFMSEGLKGVEKRYFVTLDVKDAQKTHRIFHSSGRIGASTDVDHSRKTSKSPIS